MWRFEFPLRNILEDRVYLGENSKQFPIGPDPHISIWFQDWLNKQDYKVGIQRSRNGQL